MLGWVRPLQSAPQPLRLTIWSTRLPTPDLLKDKTIALISTYRQPEVPASPAHTLGSVTADKGFGVCSAVVQGWSWGIVFIECDRFFYKVGVWKIYFCGSKRLLSVMASLRATGVGPG